MKKQNYANGKTPKEKLNWTYLTNNLELNNISPSIKRIQFELYSTNSSTGDYPNGKDLLDLEDIPILHSLEGTEIGGENLLLWTKEFPIEDDKWNIIEAELEEKTIIQGSSKEEIKNILVYPIIEEQELEDCFILNYSKNFTLVEEEENVESYSNSESLNSEQLKHIVLKKAKKKEK